MPILIKTLVVLLSLIGSHGRHHEDIQLHQEYHKLMQTSSTVSSTPPPCSDFKPPMVLRITRSECDELMKIQSSNFGMESSWMQWQNAYAVANCRQDATKNKYNQKDEK